MELGLAGKRAIVCGSSQGLGYGCALALAEAGVSVVLNGRTKERLDEAAEEIMSATGTQVTGVAADVCTSEGQDALLAACPAPHILVTNAGGPPFRDFRTLDRSAMLKGVEMNMITPIELIQRVIDPMIAQRFGRIVNITSITVKMPVAGLDLSSGARAGLTSFLAGIARTVARHNVTINHLLPGYFDTQRLRQGFAAGGGDADAKAEAWRTSVPAQRFGTPREFGQACAYLCSEQAGFITGQSLLMDGGLYNSAF